MVAIVMVPVDYGVVGGYCDREGFQGAEEVVVDAVTDFGWELEEGEKWVVFAGFHLLTQ